MQSYLVTSARGVMGCFPVRPRRYFVLNERKAEVTFYKNDKMTKPLGTYAIGDARLEGRFGDFVLETPDEVEIELKAPDVAIAQQWVDKLVACREALDALVEKGGAPPEDPPPSVAAAQANAKAAAAIQSSKEGWLQIPSASRFVKWQDRYCRLRGGSLLFYRKDISAENDYEGELVLTPTTVIDKNMRVITVRTGEREFELQAPTLDACEDWMVALDQALHSVSKAGLVAGTDAAPVLRATSPEKPKETPQWIVRWDKENDNVHVLRIQETLDAQFGQTGQSDLLKTLSAATRLIEELSDRAKECLPINGQPGEKTVAGREPRPDIFEVILRFYHIRLVQELSVFLTDQNYTALSVRELLRLMDLITAYSNTLSEILVGPVGENLREHIPAFALADNADNMADVYLQKLKVQINQWVDNIVQSCVKQGESRVMVKLSDSKLQTPGPTDLFNLLNESLTLARVSGVRRLQASVVSLCAVSMADYLYAVTRDLVERKNQSFPYATALANDGWTVIEHIDRLEKDQEAVFSEWGIDFDPLREKCMTHASRCLEVLANMARSDVRVAVVKLFTREHLDAKDESQDPMAVVLATLDDYFDDFVALLETPFLPRVAQCVVRNTVADYLGRLCAAYRDEGLTALTKTYVDLIVFDRTRIIALLEGRFPRVDPRRLFQNELAPMNDVIEMLTANPSLCPSTAVTAAKREPMFKLHIQSTAKMCVDLVCNTDVSGKSDKLARDVKLMIVSQLDELSVPKLELDANEYDRATLNAYAIMWPALKLPGSAAIKAARNFTTIMGQRQVAPDTTDADRAAERNKAEQQSAPQHAPSAATDAQAKQRPGIERQVSWQPPPKPAAAGPLMAAVVAAAEERQTKAAPQPWQPPKPPAEVAAAAAAAAGGGAAAAAVIGTTAAAAAAPAVDVGEHAGSLTFRDLNKPKEAPTECVVSLKRVSDKTTDLALLRHNPKAGTTARVLVTDIIRVEYWEGGLPGHFGPDGKHVADAPTAPGRTANRDVEFSVTSKAGERMHFTCANAADGAQWVAALRRAATQAYAKWGSQYKEETIDDLQAMSIKELKQLAKKRGVDVSGMVEKGEMVVALAPRTADGKIVPPKPKEEKPPVKEDPKLTASKDNEQAVNPFGDDKFNPFASTSAAKAGPKKDAKDSPPAVPLVAAAAGVASGTAKPPSDAPVGPSMAAAAAAAAKPAAAAASKVSEAPMPPAAAAAAVTPAAAAGAKAAPAAAAPASKSAAAPAAAAAVGVSAAAAAAAAGAAGAAKKEPPPPAAVDEEAFLDLQGQIIRGTMLIEEGEPQQAQVIFEKSIKRAKELGSLQQEAKAQRGLASAYRDMDKMRRAAGPTFEVAASIFGQVGETSDRIECLLEASDVYLRVGQKDSAIRCLERYDTLAKKAGQPPQFAEKIAKIKASS